MEEEEEEGGGMGFLFETCIHTHFPLAGIFVYQKTPFCCRVFKRLHDRHGPCFRRELLTSKDVPNRFDDEPIGKYMSKSTRNIDAYIKGGGFSRYHSRAL
jgi:hypothetical protein